MITYRQLSEDKVLEKIKDGTIGECYYEVWNEPMEETPGKLVSMRQMNVCVTEIIFEKMYERMEG